MYWTRNSGGNGHFINYNTEDKSQKISEITFNENYS